MFTDTLREALDDIKRDSLTSGMEGEMDKYPPAEEHVRRKSGGMRHRKSNARNVDIDDDISEGLVKICSKFSGAYILRCLQRLIKGKYAQQFVGQG